MEKDYFAARVECGTCHTSHRVKTFSDEDIRILEDHHYYREVCDELTWLRRVSAF